VFILIIQCLYQCKRDTYSSLASPLTSHICTNRATLRPSTDSFSALGGFEPYPFLINTIPIKPCTSLFFALRACTFLICSIKPHLNIFLSPLDSTPFPFSVFSHETNTHKKSLKEKLSWLRKDHKAVMLEIKQNIPQAEPSKDSEQVVASLTAVAIRQRVEVLAVQQELLRLGEQIKGKFKDVFHPVLPPIDRLPTNITCRITLKDASKLITTRSYSTPRKYKEAWHMLIDQHLEASRIQPSNSQHVSPAFIILECDVTVLLQWVNDY
jgi:hypothetical protein